MAITGPKARYRIRRTGRLATNSDLADKSSAFDSGSRLSTASVALVLWAWKVDEEFDLVAVGVVHVHPFGEAVVELVEDHDADRFELALDGGELVEGVADLECNVRE